MSIPSLDLRVIRIRAEAQDVVSLELAHPHGAELPGFGPGAHLDLGLPGGLTRQYSLCGPAGPSPRSYRVAVGRAPASRGGSAYVHERLRLGDAVRCGQPRNLFAMVPHASAFCFIAGGIGITPILPMLHACAANGTPWRLLYCSQSRQRAAFVDEVLAVAGGQVHLHFDNEAGGRPPDLPGAVAAPREGEHLYGCGPPGLLDRVAEAAAHWPAGHVHFERFDGAAASDALRNGPGDEPAHTAFPVTLARSGKRIVVAADRSILDALEAEGVEPAYGCRSGFCGCCEVRVLAGEPVHRDTVASPAEHDRQKSVLICVSRAGPGGLVLDL